MGIGIGGGIQGMNSKDKKIGASGSTPSNQLPSLNSGKNKEESNLAAESGLPLSIVGSGVGGAGLVVYEQ